MIYVKSKKEIELMEEAYRVAALAQKAVEDAIKPGISTWELDKIAENEMRKHGAIPAEKGYPSGVKGVPDFPGSICSSVNDVVIHGIPNKREILKDGDIVSVDTVALKNGYNVESALREIFDDWYNIKYNVKMGEDNIDVMSPGKKALVLLKLLIDMAESKCPILIDQPEDDLDNRSVFDDLIPFIKKKKKDRQIIVVTHNANVVLGADADEIIVANQNGNNCPNKEYRFEYRTGAIEEDKPIIKDDGAIEDGILNKQGIQQHICDILEGGERAFELRKHKYHI